jgi:hypothetical protein
MAWGAPVVSIIVSLGFFGTLVLLITRGISASEQVAQIINITVGALAAAFATVISFWLGSSQGSRVKDAATMQLQAQQVSQTGASIETQARQTEMLKNTMQAQAKQTEALQSTVKTAIAAAPAAGVSKPSNFRRCMDIVLAYQGGLSGDPADPAAAAQFGITLGGTIKTLRPRISGSLSATKPAKSSGHAIGTSCGATICPRASTSSCSTLASMPTPGSQPRRCSRLSALQTTARLVTLRSAP